jgi:two-component system nitrogen regulation response regulator NtrX
MEFSADYGQKPKTITDDALALFVRYPWPGNVRELRNVIERLIIMAPGPVLNVNDIPPPINGTQGAPDGAAAARTRKHAATLKDARMEFEREFITQKLKEHHGNVSKTADAINVERSNLHRKIRALGIESED